MKFFLFLVCLGGAYGIIHIFVASQSLAGGLAWLVLIPFAIVERAYQRRRTFRSLDEMSADEVANLSEQEWQRLGL